MSNVSYEITRAWTATEKQRNVGIYGTISLDVVIDGKTVISLNDFKLRKSREGKWYVESPFRTYKTKDRDTGEEKDGKQYFYKMFPKKEDWGLQETVVSLARDAVEKAGTNKSQTPNVQPATTTSTPSRDDIF
tara:strand:- start:91 stop:489 length:399 start_codon:yes stop_codon:yes gene_type:complete